MNENPYAAPRVQPEITSRPAQPIRVTLGTFVFVGMGLALLLFAGGMSIAAIQDGRFARARVFLMVVFSGIGLLGMLLIVHGVLRTNTTINSVVFVLAGLVLAIFLATLISSL